MIKDYRTWALRSYQQKRADGELSIHLAQPTPGSLRTECEIICSERYDKKDERILRAFFGALKEGVTYGEQIRNFDVDKFRPLVKFVREEIETTESKNIELLAWLLNLQPRPYQEDYQYPIVKENTKTLPVDKSTEKEIVKFEKNEVKYPKSKRPVIFGLSFVTLFALIGFGAYFFWPSNTPAMTLGGPIPPPDKGACMIWINDHYESLRCEDRAERPGVLGMDSGRLAHFKRITDTLNINEASVRKIWYFKSKEKIEYYTAPGYHPIDTARWLKQLTTYMLRKYKQHPDNHTSAK